MSQPLDKGRVAFVAEKFPSNEYDANGQPKMKNRYATIGRATKWARDGGGENIQLEIDTIPIGCTGKLDAVIFWDSDSQQQGVPQGAAQGGFNANQSSNNFQQPQQAPQQGGYQPPAQGGFDPNRQ